MTFLVGTVMAGLFDGRVIWGEDLMELALTGPKVSSIES